MTSDAYQLGEPINAQGLFQLLSDEACRKGRLIQSDSQILTLFVKVLGLDRNSARSLTRRSLQKFDKGELFPSRRFDPLAAYSRIVEYIVRGGKVEKVLQVDKHH